MKPIIGIITRKSISDEGHNTNIIYDDIVKCIQNNGGIAIGIILNKNYKELINLCDGIIFQGGDDFEEYDFVIAPMLYMTDQDTISKLTSFVANGGVLYATYTLGMVDDTDLCHLGGFPGGSLKDVFGIWNELLI